MKVKFYLGNGMAQPRKEIFDVERDFNLSPEEWSNLTEQQKDQMAYDWATNYIEWGWEEIKE
jgi:hypothetical protein